jgi:hypothetical protein
LAWEEPGKKIAHHDKAEVETRAQLMAHKATFFEFVVFDDLAARVEGGWCSVLRRAIAG